ASTSAIQASNSAVSARSRAKRASRSRSRSWSLRWESEYLSIAKLLWPGAGLLGHGSRGARIVACAISALAEPRRANILMRYEVFLGVARPRMRVRLQRTLTRDLEGGC